MKTYIVTFAGGGFTEIEGSDILKALAKVAKISYIHSIVKIELKP